MIGFAGKMLRGVTASPRIVRRALALGRAVPTQLDALCQHKQCFNEQPCRNNSAAASMQCGSGRFLDAERSVPNVQARRTLSSSSSRQQQQRPAVQLSADPFLSGTNSAYVEEMYVAWKENPKSVHVSWDAFFRNYARGMSAGDAYTRPPMLGGGASPGAAVVTYGGAQTQSKSVFFCV